tara:strand:- start:3635 stop:4483 length:849 start_codon:yes stop_codon:yes gene_type:complete
LLILQKIFKKEIGETPKKIVQLTGGSINNVYRCKLIDRDLVIKLNISHKHPKMFEKEKSGLELISKSKFLIPKPIIAGSFENYDYLILEYIKPGTVLNWQLFGKNLASLHKINNDKFGLNQDNYIGSLKQHNNFQKDWGAFYSNQRLLKLAKDARDLNLLSKIDSQKIDSLCKNLKNIVPKSKPSLIHGDLWVGNLMSNVENKPVLFDPAVYFGHPEMDWAMLSLFGSYPEEAMKNYCEFLPLENGFNDRKDIHQLYPLMVHLILFGSSYYQNVTNILNRYN